MQLRYQDRPITTFTISPRTRELQAYWRNIEQCIAWSAAHGATGILLFEGNDTFISPWVAAQVAFERTSALVPLIAVNPIYAHPFQVAKLVSSYAQVYRRRTYLNMITGTALSYLQAFNDELDHDQRYARVGEYVQVIRALLASDAPVSFSGHYYQLHEMQLEPGLPSELQPEFFFAGASEAAARSAALVDGTLMTMLGPELADSLAPAQRGIHLGLVTRRRGSDAWASAEHLFPEDRRGARVQELTMKNTDSVWKQRMFKAAQLGESARPGYWLRPFRDFKADCPYFVGSHDEAGALLAALVRGGIRHIILDIPCAEEEFANVERAFRCAQEILD
jgi:alkanesulfonate monooxygenase